MTVPDRPFAAILESQPAGLRLSGGVALVCICYVALLLAGLGLSGRAAPQLPPPERAPHALVVTLFDRPPPAPELAARSGQSEAAASAAQSAHALTAPRPERMPHVEPSASAKREKPLVPQPAAAATAIPEHAVLPGQDPVPPATPPTSAASQLPAAPAIGNAVGAVAGDAPAADSGKSAGPAQGRSGSPAAHGGASTVLPFSDGMTRPKLIDMIPPQYAREAREANVKGLFLAECVISSAGSLQNCRVLKGLPYMDQAVLSALARWRYTPVIYQGKPVAVDYVIQVRLSGP